MAKPSEKNDKPDPKLTFRERWQFANVKPGSKDFGKSRADWKASKDGKRR